MSLTKLNNGILDKIYLENFGKVRLVLDLDTIEEYNEVRNMVIDNQVLAEKIKEWYDETLLPIPEGHLPIMSLGGVSAKLKNILETTYHSERKA